MRLIVTRSPLELCKLAIATCMYIVCKFQVCASLCPVQKCLLCVTMCVSLLTTWSIQQVIVISDSSGPAGNSRQCVQAVTQKT